MTTTTLAQRIRDCRYAKGWGPDELAGRAHVSRTALYQIECGKTETPRAGTLSRIARALGVTVAELLDREGQIPGTDGAHESRRLGLHDIHGDTSWEAPSATITVRDTLAGASSTAARRREVERMVATLLESPLGESLARIVEETYRLLPQHAEKDAI